MAQVGGPPGSTAASIFQSVQTHEPATLMAKEIARFRAQRGQRTEFFLQTDSEAATFSSLRRLIRPDHPWTPEFEDSGRPSSPVLLPESSDATPCTCIKTITSKRDLHIR